MVWLVTIWKQKHHMSKLYLTPAVPHVIDKANEVKFRTNMGRPCHRICIAIVVHKVGGTVEPQELMDHLNICAPQVKTVQVPSLHLVTSRPTCWVQPGVKQVARQENRQGNMLLQTSSLQSSGEEVHGVLLNSVLHRTVIKFLNSQINLDPLKEGNSGCSTVGGKWFHGQCCTFLILSSSLVSIHFQQTLEKQLTLHS